MPELEILRQYGGITGYVNGEVGYLGHIDYDVTGGVDHQHEVVPPCEVVSPCRPMQEGSILEHLYKMYI